MRIPDLTRDGYLADTPAQALYRAALGRNFDILPAEVRRMHEIGKGFVATGRCDIERPTGWIASLATAVAGFPKAGRNVPLRVGFLRAQRIEIWSRWFGGATLRSAQFRTDATPRGHIVERFGAFEFDLALTTTPTGLRYTIDGMRWRGLAVPRPFRPTGDAFESVCHGRFHFDVRVGLPLVGPILRYSGWLAAVPDSGRDLPRIDAPLMLFDGICRFCSGGVPFMIARCRDDTIRYVGIQSAAGRAILAALTLPVDDWKSAYVIDGGEILQKSRAMRRLVGFMRFPWPLLRLAGIVPRPILDWLYDRVALNRYALFGKREVCFVPPPGIAARFLDR